MTARTYGVMVSTLDFESNNPSSILGMSFFYFPLPPSPQALVSLAALGSCSWAMTSKEYLIFMMVMRAWECRGQMPAVYTLVVGGRAVVVSH